nr:proximal tail sheath stabilization [uncultured Mediterranean phage uvMED]
MLGTYFYHEILRKTVIAFGTLFNDIHVQKTDRDGSNVISDLNIPLSYGPKSKFLAKILQQADLNKATAITLPRMSFEMNSITYDPSRKTSVTKTFKAVDTSDNDKIKKVFLPVPYNVGFELNIMCKLNDDALQIIEQILPFFQPSFNVTVDLVDSIGEKKDIPIILENISFSDEYEGDFSSRRVLTYTLTFQAKTYLFGPIAKSTEGLIRKVQVDYYGDTDKQVAKREMRYTVVPDPIDAEADDDFGFSETVQDFTDGKVYSPTRQEDV